MNLDEAWTFILETISQVIIPAWNDLIQYLPLLILLLLILSVAGLAWYWQRNGAVNRSRVPQPIPSGRQPADLHMPGPSIWPFVAPIGLLLVLFALALGITGSLATLALFAAGAFIGIVGIVGWYREASREYLALETGGAHGEHAEITAGPAGSTPDWALQPPEGTHLPGPSAWPFLAPVGLFFMLTGLVLGPALIVGGLIMGVIAAIGWLLDAGRELEDLETHGHPSQADRNPERAWPRRLIPIYILVAAVAILLTLAPWLLSLLPGSG